MKNLFKAGIVVLFALTFVPNFIDYLDTATFLFYATLALALPTLYVLYLAWQECTTGALFKRNQGILMVVTLMGWMHVNKKAQYPISSVVWLGLGLLGLFFTLLYTYNQHKHHKNKTVFWLFMAGYLVASLAIIYFSGYHLITGNKLFWRF